MAFLWAQALMWKLNLQKKMFIVKFTYTVRMIPRQLSIVFEFAQHVSCTFVGICNVDKTLIELC